MAFYGKGFGGVEREGFSTFRFPSKLRMELFLRRSGGRGSWELLIFRSTPHPSRPRSLPLASKSKCLAQSNKSRTRRRATKTLTSGREAAEPRGPDCDRKPLTALRLGTIVASESKCLARSNKSRVACKATKPQRTGSIAKSKGCSDDDFAQASSRIDSAHRHPPVARGRKHMESENGNSPS